MVEQELVEQLLAVGLVFVELDEVVALLEFEIFLLTLCSGRDVVRFQVKIGLSNEFDYIYSCKYNSRCEFVRIYYFSKFNPFPWNISASLNSSISKLTFVPRITD